MSNISGPEARAHQAKHLRALRRRSYAELRALPRSRRVDPSPALPGVEFRVERRDGEHGGVRIEIRACRRHLFVFLACSGTGFEKLPDGRVIVDRPPAIDD